MSRSSYSRSNYRSNISNNSSISYSSNSSNYKKRSSNNSIGSSNISGNNRYFSC